MGDITNEINTRTKAETSNVETNIEASSDPHDTANIKVTRAKRFSLIDLGGAGGTESIRKDINSAIDTINKNFESSKKIQESFEQNLLQLKAAEKLVQISLEQEQKTLTKNELMNLGIGLELELTKNVQKMNSFIQEMITLTYEQMTQFERKLENIREVLDDIIQPKRCRNLICRRKMKLIVRKSFIQITEMAKKIKSRETKHASCRLTKTGNALKIDELEIKKVKENKVIVTQDNGDLITVPKGCFEKEENCPENLMTNSTDKLTENTVHLRADDTGSFTMQCPQPTFVSAIIENEIQFESCDLEPKEIFLPLRIESGKNKGRKIANRLNSITQIQFPDYEFNPGRRDRKQKKENNGFFRKMEPTLSELLNQSLAHITDNQFINTHHIAAVAGGGVTSFLVLLISMCSCCVMCFRDRKNKSPTVIQLKDRDTESSEDEEEIKKRYWKLFRETKNKNRREKIDFKLPPDPEARVRTKIKKKEKKRYHMALASPSAPPQSLE